MPEMITGGELVARILEAHDVDTAFGVISIHNVPILDAFARRNRFRFVMARGEQGATNMADGYARACATLGVVVTSTGPGAGNAAGAMTEALSAGSPVLHITGQIDSPHLDRGRAMNHETRDQLKMLEAISKAAFRVKSPTEIASVLLQAIQVALSAPRGPVSVEIPIDIQAGLVAMPANIGPVVSARPQSDDQAIVQVARMLNEAKRPLLWLGGGAHGCGKAVELLAERGISVVTSIHGRAVLPEDHPLTLGALHHLPATEKFYDTCDLLLVVGSKLRGNETKNHTLRLPRPIVQVDIDLAAWSRNYPADYFVHGEANDVLTKLAAFTVGRKADPSIRGAVAEARSEAMSQLYADIGPYGKLCDILRAKMPRNAIFVRDVTIAANTWGNRLLPLYEPTSSINALGGGIGQGLQHAIGAAVGGNSRKVVALCGDGGLAVNIGEMFTLVQEKLDVTLIVMNDGGYGVIRNITAAACEGRQFYSDLFLPDLQEYARVLGMSSWRVSNPEEFGEAMERAIETGGPTLVEVDMNSIGPYPVKFAGPRTK